MNGENKDYTPCPLIGKGWDEELAECLACEEDYPKEYEDCKRAVIASCGIKPELIDKDNKPTATEVQDKEKKLKDDEAILTPVDPPPPPPKLPVDPEINKFTGLRKNIAEFGNHTFISKAGLMNAMISEEKYTTEQIQEELEKRFPGVSKNRVKNHVKWITKHEGFVLKDLKDGKLGVEERQRLYKRALIAEKRPWKQMK